MRPVLLFVIAAALLLVSPGAVPAERSVRSRARPASSYRFEDLAITRQVAADGKPNSGVRTRKLGPIVREPDGTSLNLITRPYEKAFGCLKMSS
jgi:hypothetical protein